MSTKGWRKPVCKRGHVNPKRYKHGGCVECGRINAKARYHKDRAGWKAKVQRRTLENPEARRDYGRARRLGVSVKEVRAAIARAAGRCEACGDPVTHASLVMDHDHKTGRIRGVLCRRCNVVEGIMAQNGDRMTKIKAYLDRAIAWLEGQL